MKNLQKGSLYYVTYKANKANSVHILWLPMQDIGVQKFTESSGRCICSVSYSEMMFENSACRETARCTVIKI